jgi:acetate kinase
VRVLALNPGSSSLKAALRTPELELSVLVERVGAHDGVIHVTDEDSHPFSGDIAAAVDAVADIVSQRSLDPDAVAHRVVHGGPRHQEPAVIDDQLVAELREVVPLAPLHLPGALDTIAHARRRWPDATHVACFDTGFHRDLPERSRRLPVPDELADLGIRRYGFHGLSVQSVLLARPDVGNVVVAHLGSGCSVTAVGSDGRPRHTTMSLTPTSGMMSATRAGDLDPEIPLYLIEQHGYTPDALRTLLDRQSGLAGIADGRHDVRDLLAADDPAAALALDMFVYSAAMAIASCATTLDGWDTLVFTGGIGEHAADVRGRICARLRLDGVQVAVVAADEERVMDRLVRDLIGAPA